MSLNSTADLLYKLGSKLQNIQLGSSYIYAKFSGTLGDGNLTYQRLIYYNRNSFTNL